MKIMKTHKTLLMHSLVSLVIEAVRVTFLPLSKFVKEQIETLIEMEYLQRDAKNRTLLIFVAGEAASQPLE